MATEPQDGTEAQWAQDHPVLEVLRERRASGSLPGSRSDQHKVALAIEGGGMRGIVSAAMITALEDLGLTSAFDVVYGASSGSVNASYFLVGESWYPLSIYYDDLTTRNFLDFRRAALGKPMLNLDYAFDIVVDRVKPLDYTRLLSSVIPLHVAMTSVDDMATLVIANFEGKSELKAALRASGWLPIAAPGTARFRGKRVIDGGVLIAHPFRIALEDGCTHILSLSTRPMQPPRRRPSKLQHYTAIKLNAIRRGLGTAFISGIRLYFKERIYLTQARWEPEAARRLLNFDRAEGVPPRIIQYDHRNSGPVADPKVLDLAPLPGTPEIKRHEMDRGLLIEGARNAYELIVLATERKHVRVIPRLTIPEHEHDQLPAGPASPQSGLSGAGKLPT